ncbi:hypothetical protein LCGC14_2516780, partial [marine sediment metagenome]
MPDKPETKEAPLVAGTPEAEMAQLASQIAGEADPTIVEGKDSVSPQDQPPPKGKDAKPKGEDTPASKGEDETEVEGDGEPKDGKKKGDEEEDPLKDLAADTDGVLKVLLEHP